MHIDYMAQFSGAAAPRGSRAASGRKRSSGGGGGSGTRDHKEGGSGKGHWLTEYGQRGPVKVYRALCAGWGPHHIQEWLFTVWW